MCNSLFNYTWSCGYGLHYLVAIFAEFDMDSLLLFPPHLRRSFRLVINQSVGSSGVKSAPGDHSCLSVECFLRLSLLLSTLYNKHCYLISPLFCSYMWELILKTHIWCASGFVLKIGCYKGPSILWRSIHPVVLGHARQPIPAAKEDSSTTTSCSQTRYKSIFPLCHWFSDGEINSCWDPVNPSTVLLVRFPLFNIYGEVTALSFFSLGKMSYCVR